MYSEFDVAKKYILYTALISPSLIFALQRSETDSPILEFALSSILLYNLLCKIQFAQF